MTPLPAAAQFSSALQGTITDTQQAFVPNATVRVINTTTGVTREAETSADGVYRVPSLGAGVYTVEVEKSGFLKAQRQSLRLGISETLRLDFTLEVSGVAETVTVESRAPLVETEQGRVSGRVDRTLLQEMPLSGRNLYNLLALQPGVTGRGFSASISGGGGADDSFAGESAPRINASGQRDEANNFTVDDTSTNGVARGGITNLTPNTESVEEVRVVSNNFSAVDGRNPGAQIQVITKGGTNEFRGSGSYYFTGNQLSAKNVFETSVPEFSKNQFGYSLGGPIARNRLFFFTLYEGLRQTGARGSTFTVETPDFRNFIQQTRPNSIAAQLLRNFAPAVNPTSNFRDLGSPAPGANAIGPADGILDVGSAFFVPEGWRDGDQFSARVDYEMTPGKDRLYGNFYRTRSYAVTGGIRPAFNRPTPNWTTFGNVNYTRTFNATKLNEFRGGVMRLVGLPDTPGHLEIPGITITGVTGFGQSGYPNGWWQTNWHFKDIFTWVASSHMLKMGGELRQMYGSATNTNNYIPAYSFSNLLNFADDEALQMTRYVDPRTGEPVTAYSELTQTEWAIFINDDWKVTSNFTINAGLRYENYGTFKDSDDGLRNLIFGPGATPNDRLASARVDFVDKFFPTDNNNIAPRLGFAWDPTGDGRTSVRGGYGVAFDRLMNLPTENYRHSPPLRASVALGQFFGTPVHLRPRRSVEALSRLPGRSRAAGRPRSPQRRHRGAGQPDDRRSRPDQSRRPQLVRRRPARALVGHRRRRELHGIGRAQSAQRLQRQQVPRRSPRRPVRRIQPELRIDHDGDVDLEVRLSRRHDRAEAQLPAGLHGAGGVYLRQGDGRCGSGRWHHRVSGRRRHPGGPGCRGLRRRAQGLARWPVGAALFQEWIGPYPDAARRVAAGGVGNPAERIADQRDDRRDVPQR